MENSLSYRRYVRCVALAGAAFLFIMTGANYLWKMFDALQYNGKGFSERFSQLHGHALPWLNKQRGGFWGQYGWYLRLGESGGLVIKLPSGHDGTLKLRIWAWNAGMLRVWIQDSTGRTIVERTDGRVWSHPVRGMVTLHVKAANRMSSDQVILDRLEAAWFPSSASFPSAIPFVLSGMLLLAVWRAVCFKRGDDAPRVWWGYSLIFLAALIGFAVRMELFDLVRALPLDPDVMAYLQYAHGMEWFTSDHGFYSGTFSEREPLHVAIINLLIHLPGFKVSYVRFYTVALSTLLILIVGIFFWRVSNRWWLGVIGAWVMAMNGAWIDESVRGLRLEAFTLLLLATLSVWLWTRGWRGSVLLGVTTGCMALLRAPALSVVLPFFWGAWLINVVCQRRSGQAWEPSQWRFHHLVVVTALGLGLFVPHLYGLYRVHGDPAWPSYGYARWNANLEFPDRIGTPGFPSKEEFAKSPYAGPKITYAYYMFGLHSIPQLMIGQVKGWIESNGYMLITLVPRAVGLAWAVIENGKEVLFIPLHWGVLVAIGICAVFTAVGWIRLLVSRKRWWLPLMVLWGTWYAAYLYSVHLVEPFRHTGHVFPLLLLCMLCGFIEVVRIPKIEPPKSH